ncbi:MAG: hypothetical protein HYZ09_00910 [Candidatus Kerfeldbacteria bacterium]|nr:hypothetical protein [Candidatus Kerfeldbacteria bacterium]
MQARSTAGYLLKDLLFDFAKFPVWWYSAGLVQAARFAWGEIAAWARRLSLVILFRNVLKPMYGDYSKSGRAISLVLRLVVFGFRVVVMVLWSAVVIGLLALWIALPVGTGFLFARSLVG